jgi:uncharacterized ion transporter superfamily protein YfcC
MRITCRTLLILLLITILIMAYCSTTVEAGALSRLKHPRGHSRNTRTRYKIKRKTKIKTKTKIRYGKKPGLMHKIKHPG